MLLSLYISVSPFFLLFFSAYFLANKRVHYETCSRKDCRQSMYEQLLLIDGD